MLQAVVAFFLGLANPRSPGVENLVKPLALDPRPTRLEAFFDRYHCPQPRYTYDYLRAAETYAIDYRVLPAISVWESTCGRWHRLNNLWGWDLGRAGFKSVSEGIDYVSWQFAEGLGYRGKTVERKLRVYNPTPEYALKIAELMREIEDIPQKALTPMPLRPAQRYRPSGRVRELESGVNVPSPTLKN